MGGKNRVQRLEGDIENIPECHRHSRLTVGLIVYLLLLQSLAVPICWMMDGGAFGRFRDVGGSNVLQQYAALKRTYGGSTEVQLGMLLGG